MPSLALGTGLVTPLAMTAAFAMFPNGGLAVRPRDITRVRDADGSTALRQDVETERVVSPEVAFQMVSMLEDVVDRGTGAAARRLGVRFPVGGKTGTTDDFKDAWFVGFSSSVVAGVWVGFDQPEPIGDDAFGVALRAADLGRLHAAGGAGSRRPAASSGRPACTTSRSARSPTCSRWTAARSTPSTSRKATRCPSACARCIAAPSASACPRRARAGSTNLGRRIRDIFR